MRQEDTQTTVAGSVTAHAVLRRMPPGCLAAPARIRATGYVSNPDSPQEADDRFIRLAKHLEIDVNDIRRLGAGLFACRRLGPDQISIKLERLETHYVIETWLVAETVTDFGPQPELLDANILPAEGKLTELDILWLGEGFNEESILSLFESSSELLSSAVMDGKLQVITGYDPDSQGVERYLIFPTGVQLPSNQMGTVLDSLVDIENNFHLMYASEVVSKRDAAIEQLREIETKTNDDLKRINEALPRADSETLKLELHALSNDFVKVSELNEEFQQYHHDVLHHERALTSAFETLKEESIDVFLPLSSPILKSAKDISRKCDAFFSRIERVRRKKADTIGILRTKVELLERDLGLSLQRSQMAMQRTVEGLYVFIVAFYLTELAHIVFEALEEREIIHTSPIVLAALFIPVAILAGLFLSGKISEWFFRRQD